MSLLKQLDRAARTAWCPSARYPNLLASGTIAGTIDDSFVTKSQLEIYDIDLAGPTNDMKLLGSIESKDCFHSVAWGAKGIEEGQMSHGLVAGGMSDGSINIWNVDAILQRQAPEQALLSRSEVHKGQVLGLQFHPTQPNLLASGATDGEVYVWDLANLKAPVPNKPNPTAKPVQMSGITSLAWNKNAPQILASSSEVGETTVWDLRQKRSIITIRNSARMNVRASGLSWNPAASVQLAVCYSNYPVAEIWDLRQSMTPKVKLEGLHSGSILSVDWCPNDPSILLTVGEDARMASWNPLNGQLLHEYQTNNIAFDVQWSPKQPNLISTSSYDNKVNVLSINTTGPSHVPSWMTRPIGASFGFGGKLVSFGFDAPPVTQPSALPTGGPPSPHKPFAPKVQLQQLVTDPEVLEKAQGLQQILKEGDFPNFCAYKISHSGEDEDEKTIWTFMKILFEDGASQRYLLLKELGFEPPSTSEIVMPQPSVPVVPDISEDDFFNQEFPTPKPDAADATSPNANGNALNDNAALINAIDGIAEEKQPESANGTATSPKPFVEDEDDKAIRQALVFGDFKAAVTKCLAVGRMADAIIFASFGPPPLWEETRAKYFESHKMPFIRQVMKNVSNSTLSEMVAESELDNWKETLSICITYTTTAKYRELVNQLAARLEESGRFIPAVVCYICSSNIDKSIEMWTTKIHTKLSDGQDGSALLALHAAIEKVAVFAQATNALQQNPPSRVLGLKYAEYANMLASQGELRGAFNYLSRVATRDDPNSAVLLDRIFHAEQDQFVREQYPMPAFPFQPERVDPDPTLAATLHARQLAQQQRQAQLAADAANRAQRAMHQQQQPGYQQHQQQMQQQQRSGPYGQPQQQVQQQQQQWNQPQTNPYNQPNPSQSYGQYGQGAYGQPQPPQPAPAQPQRPPFQPQQPQYGQPQPPAQPSAYGQPQSTPGYGQPQPSYGQPQPPQPAPQSQFNQPQRPPFQPQQPQYGMPQAQSQPPAPVAPSQPAHSMPSPTNQPPQQFVPSPAAVPQAAAPAPFVPQPAVPTPSVFTPAAPVPATAAPPKTFTPTMPSAAAAVPSPSSAASTPTDAPVQLSPADQSLINPLEQCLQSLSAVGLKTPEQKKVTEIRSKLNELAKKLSSHELSATAQSELQLLCQAVAANDFTTAQKHHLNLVKTDWASQ